MSEELIELSISEVQQAIKNKKFSCEEITKAYLNRTLELDGRINSFISVCEIEAIKRAQKINKKDDTKEYIPLKGIPISHKDIFCTKGVKTSCGSRMLDNFIPPYDATVVKKLKNAGAIYIGKTNMDEFAMGSSCENSYYGATLNPFDLSLVPGGSSGGAAAAVASKFCLAATGTDTGGSIRQPAAFCGVTGIKPTYGSASRWGMVAYASSLDQAGVFARNAKDCSLVLEQMLGFDLKDSTSSDINYPTLSDGLDEQDKSYKIGVCQSLIDSCEDEEIKKSIEQSINTFKQMGYTLVDLKIDNIEHSIPAYYIIAMAECSSNLSRFDGVRFGHRVDSQDLKSMYSKTRRQGFGMEVIRRILMGTYFLSAGYYDAYYTRAQKVRNLIKQSFVKSFEQVDAILMPVTSTLPFALNSKSNPAEMYAQDIFTLPLNLAGLPGISFPCGESTSHLPIGVQLVGNYHQEKLLLNLVNQFQLNTDWHNIINKVSIEK